MLRITANGILNGVRVQFKFLYGIGNPVPSRTLMSIVTVKPSQKPIIQVKHNRRQRVNVFRIRIYGLMAKFVPTNILGLSPKYNVI